MYGQHEGTIPKKNALLEASIFDIDYPALELIYFYYLFLHRRPFQ